MKFTISSLLTPQMLHTEFCQDWPSSSWEEDVNHNARRTPTHSNRSPEWLRSPNYYLSDDFSQFWWSAIKTFSILYYLVEKIGHFNLHFLNKRMISCAKLVWIEKLYRFDLFRQLKWHSVLSVPIVCHFCASLSKDSHSKLIYFKSCLKMLLFMLQKQCTCQYTFSN